MGAAKSGSTWLFNILQNIRPFEWPETRYISGSNSKHPTIKETFLDEFLAQSDYIERDVINKNHYGRLEHRNLLLARPDTRVLDMSRDTRDVIVSSYYDECRRNGFTGDFSEYYWKHGRLLVESMRRYHQVWSVPHDQILITSYEALKQDFESEVYRIGQFVNIELCNAEISRIESATSMETLRDSYRDDPQYNTRDNPFFRKGEIGDWQNHFDTRMLRDYEKVSQHGIGRLDRIYLGNRVRQKLSKFFG